jgi:hypothetical protein
MSAIPRLGLLVALTLWLSVGTVADLPDADSPRLYRGHLLQGAIGPASRVIDTPEALAEFVSCLPPDLPSKRQPAPANPDPLRLPGFQLDFAKEVLVVAVHLDTVSAFPEYRGVRQEQVLFEISDPPPEARPYGWGVYTGVVLPRRQSGWKIQLTMVEKSW